MPRKSLFEAMEREIDFTKEFFKAESILQEEYYLSGYISLEQYIQKSFIDWKFRDNYNTYYELKEHLGFDYCVGQNFYIDINDYFLYCEMTFNLLMLVANKIGKDAVGKRALDTFLDTMRKNLSKLNHEISNLEDGRFIINQKNEAATAVAEISDRKTATEIIEYNHYLLRGDLDKKRKILLTLADKIEPKRDFLKAINKNIESNLFSLLNNCNIRHNNVDVSNKKYFNIVVAKMTEKQLEGWYDETYQLALLAILLLDNVNIEKKIEDLKNEISKSK
jgi:hypothetical protein